MSAADPTAVVAAAALTASVEPSKLTSLPKPKTSFDGGCTLCCRNHVPPAASVVGRYCRLHTYTDPPFPPPAVPVDPPPPPRPTEPITAVSPPIAQAPDVVSAGSHQGDAGGFNTPSNSQYNVVVVVALVALVVALIP